jgi:hypothetical protein
MLERLRLQGSNVVLEAWAANAKAWAAPYIYVTKQAWPALSMVRHPWLGWVCARGAGVSGWAGTGEGIASGH